VATVYLFTTERPSALFPACAPAPSIGTLAHPLGVAIPAVAGAPTTTAQHKTVQKLRTQARQSWLLADQHGNGFAAKAIGMGHTSAKGVQVSGAPPRGKPV
jgi:hypothetical protein